MQSLFSLFNKNALLKIASFNSVHVALRIVTGAIMAKIIAYYVGAAGMGVMGNLRNFVQGVQTFSVLGLENGLVKNSAQFKDDQKKLSQFLSTGWTLTCIATVVVMIVLFMAAPWLDRVLIAADYAFATMLRVFAGVLPFWVLFVFISSLLQGFEYYKKFIALNIIIGLSVFAMSVVLIYQYHLIGALYSLILTPVIQCFVALFFWKNSFGRIRFSILFNFKLDRVASRQLLTYSVMALVSALLLPLTTILVRDHLRFVVSDVAAGFWEAVMRVSSYYMMFITSLISLYILPKLSTDATASNYRVTIISFYKVIIPLVIVGLSAVYFLRHFIIEFLFTSAFQPAASLFKWQLLGDFLKVITTVLAFRFIALNDLRRYIIAELVSVACFYISAHFLINAYGISGVVMSHVVTYAVYLLVLIVLLNKDLKSHL